MAWISANWWYNLSNLSVEGGDSVLRGLTAAASVWPPSLPVEGVAPLAYAWVAVRSTIRIPSASSMGSCHGGSCGWATVVD
jgi:hypothetical protein